MGDLRGRRPRTGADHDRRGGCRVSDVSHVAVVAALAAARARRSWLRPERVKELSLVAVLLATILLFTSSSTTTCSARFVNRVLDRVAITAVIAAGQTLVILTRNIDLSVGSIVGVSRLRHRRASSADHRGLPAGRRRARSRWRSGPLLGLVNGLFVAYGRVPSIIVTLGTLAIYRSVLISYAGGQTITTDSLPHVAGRPARARTVFTHRRLRDPHDVRDRGRDRRGAAVSCCSSLRVGRMLYAIGSNPRRRGRPACRRPAHHDHRVRRLRRARRPRRVPVPRPLRHHHGHGRRRAGARGDRGRRRRRRQHARRVGHVVGALLGAVLIGMLDQSLVRVPSRSASSGATRCSASLILLAVVLDVAVGRRLRSRAPARDRGPSTDPRAGRADRTARDAGRAGTPWELLLVVILAGNDRLQHRRVGVLPRRRQPRQPLPAVDREGDHRGDDDVRHHVRRDRPLGRVGRWAWSASVLAAAARRRSVPFLARDPDRHRWLGTRRRARAGMVRRQARTAVAGRHARRADRLRGAARVFVEDRSIGDFPGWFDRPRPGRPPRPAAVRAARLLRRASSSAG